MGRHAPGRRDLAGDGRDHHRPVHTAVGNSTEDSKNTAADHDHTDVA